MNERAELEKSVCLTYAETFSGKNGTLVLADLKSFCGAEHTCFDDDPRRTAFMLGARSVWLYIQERITMQSLSRIVPEGTVEVKVQ